MSFIKFSFPFLAIALFSCSEKESPLPVPADAQVIFRINSSEILQEIAIEKWKEFSFDDLFDVATEDTSVKKKGIENILNDPSGAGIDILQDVWSFYRNSELGIIISLEDREDFENAIRENITNQITKAADLSAFTNERISAVWSSDRIIFLLSENKITNQHLFSFFSKERELFNPIISEIESEKEVLVWTSNEYLKSFLPASLQSLIHSDKYSISSIDFDNGKAEISNEKLLSNHKDYLKTFMINPRLYNHQNILSMGLCLNISSIPINDSVFNQSFLSNCLDGNLYFMIDSIKKQEKIFKTVEVDEEFNTIEKTDTIIQQYPSFMVQATVKDKDSCLLLLNNLEKNGLLTKENNIHKVTLSSFPVLVALKQNTLVIIDDIESGLKGKESPLNISPKPEKSYLRLTLRYKPVLKKLSFGDFIPENLKTFTLSLLPDSNNLIKVNGTLETTGEEYSLLTILDLFNSSLDHFLKKEDIAFPQ